MSFGCTIILKDGTQITSAFGEGRTIHFRLLGLGPNAVNATPAPNGVANLRDIVINYSPAEGPLAQECFKELRVKVKENLDSLKRHNCPDCPCQDIQPERWSKEACEAFLSFNAEDIHSIEGGY